MIKNPISPKVEIENSIMKLVDENKSVPQELIQRYQSIIKSKEKINNKGMQGKDGFFRF